MLTLDPEGRRPASTFLNLGVPTRAWQFCSLSNERDRPALALPVAQGLIDLLSVYGWRDSRPHAKSVREDDATVLQPLTLANGNAGHRLVQLSDGALTTELCVDATDVRQLTRNLYLQLLSRETDAEELAMFSAELGDGFDSRIVPGAKVRTQPRIYRHAVSWSNHLNSEATRIKMQLEEDARRGDPPRLQPAETDLLPERSPAIGRSLRSAQDTAGSSSRVSRRHGRRLCLRRRLGDAIAIKVPRDHRVGEDGTALGENLPVRVAPRDMR